MRRYFLRYAIIKPADLSGQRRCTPN